MTFNMAYYLTGNDLKCHLNLSDVHATGPKSRRGGEGRREWNRGGGGPGSLAREEGLYFNICAGVHWVSSYATADGAGLPT